MSYILEALKKSEKERGRNQEQNSSSSTIIYPGYTKSGKSSNKKYLYIAATTLAACIVVFILITFLKTQPEKADNNFPENTRANQHQPAAIDTPGTRAGNTIVIRPQTGIHQESSASRDQQLTSFADPHHEAGKVYPDYNDLPQQTKNSIPAFTIAGHTYSDQSDQRMLILNNTIIKEGQAIGNGLRLVEITWNGAILGYNDIVFSVSASK